MFDFLILDSVTERKIDSYLLGSIFGLAVDF